MRCMRNHEFGLIESGNQRSQQARLGGIWERLGCGCVVTLALVTFACSGGQEGHNKLLVNVVIPFR